MMSSIRFLRNEAGKAEGLAYAGFETFKGSPYPSCARETGQNSRDAANGDGPVKVTFDLRHMPREAVPFADELQRAIQCCLAAPQDEKTEAHLRRALATVSAPVIKILEISDYNTTGLTGPTDDAMSVFTALVKGDGVTKKADETSAGSYGIGKNAAYAVSELQTVIYSTCYQMPNEAAPQFAAQGRLRLISHSDGQDRWSAEGYWGGPDFSAISEMADVPSWMRRSQLGTSIFSVGFDEREEWAGLMRLSLATNFFAAIHRGEIEFEVDGQPLVQATLESVLEAPTLTRLAEANDQLAELERARRVLKCIDSDASERHTISIEGLGDFTLHLLISADLPREVQILRNGIYITDNFAKFSKPLRQFRGTREFTAVLEPARSEEGRKPSALLKKLENPAHDAFEPDRITDTADREVARRQIKKLADQARAIIRASAQIEESERTELDELSQMFATTGATRDDEREDVEKDPDAFIYKMSRRIIRRNTAGLTGKGKGKKRGGKDSAKPSSRTGEGNRTGQRNGSSAAVPLEAMRSAMDAADPRIRSLWFTPRASGDLELAVLAVGLKDDFELRVDGSPTASVQSGRVRTNVKAGSRVKLDVTFAEPFTGPIELAATRFVEAADEEGA